MQTVPVNEALTELLKKVRSLEIKSKRLTNHLFTGEYHTAFKGRGMSFKEVREYQAGDDIRFIDWNVSARSGHTYTKVFEEERELSVYLLIDVSASNFFGTHGQSKQELIAEVSAVLSFSAISNNDKAGAIFFSDRVEKYLPARKGKDHVLLLLRELLSFRPQSAKTDIIQAIRFLNGTTRHKSIVFILSDFADEGYKEVLRVTAKRHDVIGIQVYDRHDAQLPDIGLVQVQDPEKGLEMLLDTGNAAMRARYQAQFSKITGDAKATFRNAGADLIQLATGEDYVNQLQHFFMSRVK